jgi:hypothetical protein
VTVVPTSPDERSDEEVEPCHRASGRSPNRSEHHHAQEHGEEEPDHCEGDELLATTCCYDHQDHDPEPDQDWVASTPACRHGWTVLPLYLER